ncbi:MAG: gliding motility-associated C-terminal domain-containing protein, partial [Flavisolibacter sp.]|nr:gliding motility-associated C-terminal domain-containing protein [Flavisolibacter sp.]
VSFEAFEEMNARFIWDFGDGNVIDTTINKIEHVYNDFGSFTPRIIMTDPSGTCKVPLTGNASIEIYGAKASFTIKNPTNLFCDSTLIRFKDSTTYHDQSISYKWNYSDGNISVNPKDSAHFYPNPGNYDIFLAVTTSHGCTDSIRSKPLKVVQSPLIAIQGDSVICANERMRHAGVFQRSDTSSVRWLWQFPNGNSAMQQYPANQLYNTTGNYVVTAYAINSSGCADTATQRIRVNPIPSVDMPSMLTTQVGFPVTIPATYTSNVVKYLWQPAATLDCANCPQPVANPKFNTLYSVTFTDSNGCRNTGEIQVVVLCKNANVFLPNTFSPNGDGSNDVFYVRGKLIDRVKSLRIFSRWGEVVFDKRDFPVNDPSVGWDGKYKGARPIPDVYVYQVEVYCDNGEIIRFEGNVALIL